MELRADPKVAADLGQLVAKASSADQKRAQDAATAAWRASGADDAGGAFRDAYIKALGEPKLSDAELKKQIAFYKKQTEQLRRQQGAGTLSEVAATEAEGDGEAKQLLQKVKDAGVAGAVSYAGWELVFWAASVPVCLAAYYQVTGHFPDFDDQEDMAKLGAEAFAFVNVARLAVPQLVDTGPPPSPRTDAHLPP